MGSLLDRILEWENIQRAMKRVCANKGSSGVDGMKVEELNLYISDHWKEIEQAIRERRYKPQPVERVEIPKENGGVRKLGIPTVVDRTIQQAIAQVLSPIFERQFSENSYGFRPGRSCEQAIVKLLEYFNDGSIWVVDIDLEKFFDTVPQDRLMSIINRTIHDGDTESLIRKYLQAGVMVNGEYEETPTGTPQGGNLSPLLSNIMLNELDKELEVRGLKFTRYADDCVIVVGSSAAAKRVMYSITDWIERKLGLKVNAEKTCITRPTKLKYLGFGFWKDHEGNWRARPHEKSVAKFKRRLKQLCCRRRSIDKLFQFTGPKRSNLYDIMLFRLRLFYSRLSASLFDRLLSSRCISNSRSFCNSSLNDSFFNFLLTCRFLYSIGFRVCRFSWHCSCTSVFFLIIALV